MHAFVAAGSSFLVAVLWFDLMFDVQVRGHGGEALPPQVLDSITAYYRRVTTEAAPMSRLISLVMLATLAAVVAELVLGDEPVWRAILSLVLALFAIGLAGARIVRNAKTLGAGNGAPEARSRL